jgi:hypothetical protein
MAAIKDLLRLRDPRVRALEMTTMTYRLDELMSEEIAIARITAVLAAVAALLAAFGLYGLVSEAVQSRRHEMGVRQALGAQPLLTRVQITHNNTRLRQVIRKHRLDPPMRGVACADAARPPPGRRAAPRGGCLLRCTAHPAAPAHSGGHAITRRHGRSGAAAA